MSENNNQKEATDRGFDRRQMLKTIGTGGVIAIAGCSGENSGSASDSSNEESRQIQFLTMGVGDNIENFFKQNNAAFEEEFDAELEFTSVTWDNAQQTVNNRVDGDEAPDVSRWPARWIPQMAGKDELEPIDDLMQSEWGDRFYEGMIEGCKYQDTQYGAPWAASNKCFYYNKDIFDSAGLESEDPQLNTWDDMLSAAQKITEETETSALGLPAGDRLTTGSQYYHYHWSFGADLIDDNGRPIVNSDEGVEALMFYSNLVNEHEVTQPSPLSSVRQDTRQLFESGELGMVIAHVYTGLNIDEAKQNGEVDFDYGIVQVPAGPDGRYSLNTIDALCVYAQTDVKGLVEDLLRFYFEEERHFEYASNKGFMPTMKSVGNRDYFSEDDVWSNYIEAGQYARARPKLSNFNEFNNRMVQAIQEAVSGQETPRAALDSAQAELEEIV